jgi:hypothetical protein
MELILVRQVPRGIYRHCHIFPSSVIVIKAGEVLQDFTIGALPVTKTASEEKLRANYIRGMFATIQFRIFLFPSPL